MSMFTECMEDYAQTCASSGRNEDHDAVMMAIDDLEGARRRYPDRVEEINKALDYARSEMRNSGYSK